MNNNDFNDKILKIVSNFNLDLFFILFIFTLSFYIRAVLPYEAVFRGGIVGFAADDAVYHMRLVENLVHNIPHKIWFDVFTLYPSGQYLHFGPLWTYMIAISSLILGFGTPSLELTRSVGAYFPAIFGALLVFPIYFIGKEVFDRRVGLISAFIIAVIPGQILSRSVMGFTDHHIGEVFFSSLYLMFFILAIKSINGKDISFKDIQNNDWNKVKKPIIISILAGISFSLYMLQWSSGLFYGGIVAIFLVLHFIVDHMRGKSIDGLCLVSTVSFLAAFPLILLFFNPSNSFASDRYSYLHILITIGSAIFFLILGLLSIKMRVKNIDKIYYPLSIGAIYAIGLIISKLIIPDVFANFQRFFSLFQPNTGGSATIAEASPPTHQMIFGYGSYPNNFGGSYPGIFEFVSTYYLALLAMVAIGVLLIFRKWEPEKAMFLIWCITMFGLTTAQNRWFYYYSVNVAILSAFIGIGILDIAGLKDLSQKFRNQVSTPNSLQEFLTSDLPRHLLSALIVALVIMVVFLPNFTIASRSTASDVLSSSYVNSGYYQWHKSLTWMRYNTPDPGLDFNAVYDRPPAGETYQYPDTAYGVMSWWDYGHVITYFGHRIPNANPFQAGIGGGKYIAPGASTFFTAQSEEEADKVLWDLGINNKPGSRYIVSNAYMAYAINDVMAVWTEADLFRWDDVPGDDNEELTEFLHNVFDINWVENPDISKSDDGNTIYLLSDDNSVEITLNKIENKVMLTISDGRIFNLRSVLENDGKIHIYTLGTQDFREWVVISGQDQLIFGPKWYTSMEGRLHIFDGDGLKHYRLVHESQANPYARGGNEEQRCKALYNMLYGGNLQIENTGFVKIFEFVEGATITGKAPDGTEVKISNSIMTNQGRLFTYTQTTTAENGTYSFEVPYSTLGPIPGETNFDTRPTGPYTITAGDVSKTVDVAEQDVLDGGIVTVDMV